jgi:hypothetical protein
MRRFRVNDEQIDEQSLAIAQIELVKAGSCNIASLMQFLGRAGNLLKTPNERALSRER